MVFDLLPYLKNLESVTITYDSLTDDQLDTIRDMRLNSIRFDGDFPTDDDVDRLSRFRGTRFIHMPSANLSRKAQRRAQKVLSSSKVVFD